MTKFPTPVSNHSVVVLAYDELCTFEFGLAVEVFGLPRPEMGSNWYSFAVASVDEGPLRAMGGVTIEADGGLDLLTAADTIVVPGWRGAACPVPKHLIKALQHAAGRGARVLSICSGVFVLAAAGLLTNKRATTHWRYTELLKSMFPAISVVEGVLYVDEGDILTSAGSAAGLDLCLHLIRRDFGAAAANSVARRLVLPSHREGGQAQLLGRPVPEDHEASRISPLLDYIRDHIQTAHRVDDLAKRAGMSKRTFLRRFEDLTGTTPSQWILLERMGRARELLEASDMSIEGIADAAGFGSATALRHHFRVRMGTTPLAYRERFNADQSGDRRHDAVIA
ncbi:transcriptional regulator FtrA [Rhizobium sp. RAF36]